MTPPSDPGSLDLRPDPRRVLLFGAGLIAFVHILFAAFWVYDLLFWPYYATYNSVSQRFADCAKVSMAFAAIMLIAYCVEKRHTWLVSRDGISILRRFLPTRILAWSDMRRFEIAPFGVSVHIRSRVSPYQICWISRVDRSRLKELCRRYVPGWSEKSGEVMPS